MRLRAAELSTPLERVRRWAICARERGRDAAAEEVGATL